MKFPQAYILLKESTKLPPLEILEAWFETKREIYVRKISRTSRKLNKKIERFEELHRFAFKRSDYQMQCIVISGTAISPAFLWAHINDILKVYWIDSPEHEEHLSQLDACIDMATDFEACLCHLDFAYTEISNYIYDKLGQRPLGDDILQRYFIGRNWGTFSDVEIHVKQIAKNETRAGILRRIDLEGIDESTPAEQAAPP